MFCSKCGKQINDGAAFCPYCGAALSGAVSPAVESAPKGRPEIITRDVTKEMEQFTIERYQMFGWTLRGNQEVNITETYGGGTTVNGYGSVTVSSRTKTHIKLTFERNTGMNNYAILKEKYAEYQQLEDEYYAKSLLLKVFPFSVKTLLIVGISAAVLTFITQKISSADSFIETPLFLILFISLISGLANGGLWGIIIGAIAKVRRKPKILSALADLDRRMDTLAKDASAYLA